MHNGTGICYEVHGTGNKFLFLGFNHRPSSPDTREFVEALSPEYKIIIAEYPGDPNRDPLTPARVARDYLAVATAAGAKKFAFYGYSWGAACGLQLAIRTDRVEALIAGGFPMLGGPYPEMVATLRKSVYEGQSATALEGAGTPRAAAELRQYLTFYEGLENFDERDVQKQLNMPRLNFVGTEDQVVFFGGVKVEFHERFSANKRELESAGWDVVSVQGEDHTTAASPKVAIPLIRKWLEDNWRN